MSGFASDQVVHTLVLVVLVVAVQLGMSWFERRAHEGRVVGRSARVRFWTHQVVRLAAAMVLVVGLARIWFGDPSRFATIAGLATAGIAVALQRVILALAAYLVILRGKLFTVGDRITIGGVRGDVMSLGFMQTMVMEMGEPRGAQTGDPKTWVGARQYTGRVVRVTNDRIFDTPVYNYTREFPFLWEEIVLPITFTTDRARAESILLAAARAHTAEIAPAAAAAAERMRARYLITGSTSVEPAVYVRFTDNWVELSLRFVCPVHGVRPIKSDMSRDILDALSAAGIGVASSTYDIVGLPPVRVELRGDAAG